MKPDQPNEETILEQALSFASVEERNAYLCGACGGNEDLQKRVESLIDAHEAAGGFLIQKSPPEKRSYPQAALEAKPGDRIGRYKLLQKIGEGGCGAVYMAEQEEPVRRRVALKIIKLGMDTKSVIARFEAERQALAMMDHPNIAKVHDAGATDTGRPYFVMELVRGVKITDYCDEKALSTRERLDLFVQVCHAVQHAHQKGIIHRDLKPSNILVNIVDGQPVPKVIDFGIAKATNDQRLTDKTVFTAFEQFIGTPAYMSPEQAEVSGVDVDTRSDIYALGVLLYELLTGQTPFESKELVEAGLEEMLRCIREQEPPKPSTRLSHLEEKEQTTTAQRRATEASKLIRSLRGDLDWIVMKCLEKNRTRRYETASAVAQDVERHLTQEPVVARPQSTSYRVQKFVRRNKVMVGAMAAVATALVLGILASVWQATRATHAKNDAKRNEKAAQQAQLKAQEQKQRADTEARRASSNEKDALKNLITQYVDNGNRLTEEGDLFGALPWYLKALEQEKDPAAIARHRFRIGANLHLAPKLVQLWTHEGTVNDTAFSPDGRLLVSASDDNTARLWDTQTGESGPVLPHTNEVKRVRFSADGTRVLTIAGNRARLWSAADGRLISEVEGNSVTDAQFSPDGRYFLTASDDGLARLCDGHSGAVARELRHPKRVQALAFGPTGRLAVTSAGDGRVRLWDVESGGAILTNVVSSFFEADVIPVAFSPSGGIYASVSGNGGALYDAATGELRGRFMHPSQAWVVGSIALSFSPEGDRLMIASLDQHLFIWDVATGIQITTINLGNKMGWGDFGAQFSPDGRMVLTRTSDGAAHIWSSKSGGQLCPPLRHSGPVTAAVFAPDSRRLVTAGADGVLKLWDLANPASLEPRCLHPVSFRDLTGAEWSPDGSRIVTANGLATAWVWDSSTGDQVGGELIHQAEGFTSVRARWGHDGQRLVTAAGGAFRVWDGTTLSPLTPSIPVLTNKALTATFCAGGSRIVVFGELPELRFYEAASGQPIGSAPTGHDGGVWGYEVARRGRWAYSWGKDGVLLVHDATNGVPLGPPMRHNAAIWEAVASHDETRLAARCEGGTLHLWDVPTRREVLPPFQHGKAAYSVQFSPDDRWLLTAGPDGNACSWETRSGTRKLLLAHGAPVYTAAFSRDGSLIATASARGARLWDAATGEPISPWFGSEKMPNVWFAFFSPADRRLLSQGQSGNGATTQIWDFQPDNRPLEILRAHALVLGGETGSVGAQPLREAWAKLGVACRESVRVTVEQGLRWHHAIADDCYHGTEPFPLAFHAARWRQAHPQDSVTRRRLAIALFAQGRVRDAQEVMPEIIPTRSLEARPEQLDLTAFYNQRLEDSETFNMEGMVDLKPGLRVLGGTPFDIRGIIQLGGAASVFFSRSFPAKTPPIPVHRRVQRLHMLQFCCWDTTRGTLAGRFVLRYADGSTSELPIRYGIDLSNWWLNLGVGGSEAPLAEVAWRGANRWAHAVGRDVGVFKRTYENPRPEMEIENLEFQSTLSPCAPALMAITVE